MDVAARLVAGAATAGVTVVTMAATASVPLAQIPDFLMRGTSPSWNPRRPRPLHRSCESDGGSPKAPSRSAIPDSGGLQVLAEPSTSKTLADVFTGNTPPAWNRLVSRQARG